MTFEETREILKILKLNYPASFKGWNKEQGQTFLELWSEAFTNMPFDLVRKAVTSIILESEREFSPNIGQVNARIKKLLLPNTDEESANAWEEVRRFINNWHQDDYFLHYEELSPRIKKILKVTDLKAIANGTGTSTSVERTGFLKRYASVKESEEEIAITNGRLIEVADIERIKQLGLSNGIPNQIEKKER